MGIETLVAVLLGAAPLCTNMPPEVAARLGDEWQVMLEQYSQRPVSELGGCEGDSLVFSLEGDVVAMRYTTRTFEQTVVLPPSDEGEALARLVAPMVGAGDAPVATSQPLEVRASPLSDPHEHVWVYFDFGVSFTAGSAQPGGILGGAYRFDAWSFGLEMAQFAAFTRGGARMQMFNGVVWYGHDFWERHLRLDAGVAVGITSQASPSDVGGAPYWSTVALSTRGIGRARYSVLSWLDVHARGELGLATTLPGNAAGLSYAALLLGLEVTFGRY